MSEREREAVNRREGGSTKFSEFAGSKGIGIVLLIVTNREKSNVELLELHKVLVPHSIE